MPANAYVFDRSIPRVEADGSTSTNFIDLYKRGCFIWVMWLVANS